MNLALAGNIYFTLGSYLFVSLIAATACFGAIGYLIGKIVPRVRLASSPDRGKIHGSREKDLHLAHESM